MTSWITKLQIFYQQKMTDNKKIILITGGAGRIGSALARDLSSKKHKIILGDIDINKLKKLKKNLNTKNVEIFKSDLTREKQIDDLINFALKKFKKIMPRDYRRVLEERKLRVEEGSDRELEAANNG